MNFDESVKYLYGLGNEVLAMKLGLENIGRLLDALGNPQRNYLKVQIAGTNGKGSTVAFLEAMCVKSGIKTGATTSPHLISVTERVRLNGIECGEAEFASHATRVRKTSEELVAAGALETVPTYFEQVTAIALSVFAANRVELAILETGLGGRFDATTAADAEVVGITPVDYDHQRILGDTLAEIAAEKAAIIRSPSQQVVVSEQRPEARQVIFERCREIGVVPQTFCRHFFEDSPEVSFETKESLYPHVRLSLAGRHQIQNAKTAILLAEALRRLGLKLSPENIVGGLESAVHKGRLEFFEGVLFDGAHNVAGAQALQAYLAEFHPDAKIAMVYGTMKDKELGEIAAILFPLAEDLILTEPDNPRVKPVGELKAIAAHYIEAAQIHQIPDVAVAIDAARQIAGNYPAAEPRLILVTGSLYLIGEAQKILNSGVINSVSGENL